MIAAGQRLEDSPVVFLLVVALAHYGAMKMEKPFCETLGDPELTLWSNRVKLRDFYICRYCGSTDRKILDAHHIKPISQFPELKYDKENGITYCMWCHAWQGHRHNEAMREKILARYAVILHLRYVRPTDKEANQGIFSGSNPGS